MELGAATFLAAATAIFMLGLAVLGSILPKTAIDLLTAFAWPYVIAIILLANVDRLSVLARIVERRIGRGDAFKTPWLEINSSSVIPNPKREELVDLDGIALLHTSFVNSDATQRFGDGRIYHQFEVVVAAHNDVIARIAKFIYFLPEPWPERQRARTDRRDRFKLKELAYGVLIVKAAIHFIDEEEPLELNRFIDLRESGPRL